MKKLIIITPLLILLLIPPYFFGSQAERHFKKLIELANQHSAYSVKIIDYDRGWFSTIAKVEFKLSLDSNPDLMNFPSLIFMQQMQHGPLLYKTQSLGLGLMDSTVTLLLPEAWQQAIDEQQSIDQKTLQLTSRTSFDESTWSYLKMTAINFKDDKHAINIKPADASLYYDLSGHVTGNLDWQGLEVTEAGNKRLDIGPLNTAIDQQLVRGQLFAANSIFSGSFDTSITSIAIPAEASMPATQLTNLSFKTSTEVRDQLLDVKIVFAIAELKAMQLEFTHLIQDISILNLNITVLQEFAELMTQSQQNTQLDPLPLMQLLLPKMLSSEPLLKINKFGLNTTDGPIDTRLDLRINADLYNIDKPDSLLQAIEVDASGYGPEAFFRSLGLAGPIDHFVQQNMLTREPPLIKFNFTFINGQALLNGQTLLQPSI